MRVLLVGASGLLGTDLYKELVFRGAEIVAPTHAELDITDPDSVGQIISGTYGRFDVCLNAAAYTAVDRAETEPQAAWELNQLAPSYLATACAASGSALVHFSTDFVFDGEASEPYVETAPTNPLGVYGKSKLAGETAVLENHGGAVIVRTAWLYGSHGNSFPKTMIKAWKAGKRLRVVADQVGCPTYTADLARVALDIVSMRAHPGIYHAVGPESMSWHAFALRAIKAFAADRGLPGEVDIEPISTSDWPTPAARPKYSVLSMQKLTSLSIAPMRPVAESLEAFVRALPEA